MLKNGARNGGPVPEIFKKLKRQNSRCGIGGVFDRCGTGAETVGIKRAWAGAG